MAADLSHPLPNTLHPSRDSPSQSPRACSPENGFLTPSLKLKRPQLKEKYGAELKRMYAEMKK